MRSFVISCAIFSKVDHLHILGGFTSLLRTFQELNKLSSKSLQQWHHYSSTLNAIKENTYQGQSLIHVTESVLYFSSHHKDYCNSVVTCICLKSRLEWTDLQFIRDVITFLATQGWQKLIDEEESKSEDSTYIVVTNRLTSKFKIPLEHSGASINC